MLMYISALQPFMSLGKLKGALEFVTESLLKVIWKSALKFVCQHGTPIGFCRYIVEPPLKKK